MRASPRTWPSIRMNRLSTDALAFACMLAIYPYGVPVSRSRSRGTDRSGHGPFGLLLTHRPWRGQRKHRYRSRMWDDGRSGEDAASAYARGPRVLLLLGWLPRQVHRRSRKVFAQERRRGGTGSAAGHDLFLP